MIKNFKSYIAGLVSFLSSEKYPDGINPIDIPEYKSINHLASRKFFIVIVSVAILAFFYFSSVAIMFFIPKAPEFISGFVTIFSKTIEILAIIIASYVGAQAVVDLKYSSSSESKISSESLTNQVSYLDSNAKDEDYEA